MRKLLLIISTLILQPDLLSQSILVNSTSAPESALDAEDLTIEVLIDGGACSSISNFELKDNPSAQFPDNDRSWGYFERAGSDFPFESGIVLTTGIGRRAEGPDGGIEGEGDYNWTGDPDLEYMINLTTNYDVDANNATIFEFDFVPYGNEISFNYIFASDEYPTFSCSNFNDAFAFIISGPGITPDPGLSGKNIALLPNGDYVTINNVNADYCGDDEFFVEGQYSNPFEDIEYGGRTVPLTAYSEVQSGETYHIRLMIADASDTNYDSAVFLEAGSFSLGGTLVDLSGAEIGEDQILCDIEEYTMIVNLDAPSAIYQWYFNNDPIPGATSGTYTATESGNYSVEIVAGGCSTIVDVDLNFSTSPEVVDIQDFQCTEDGTYVYNLLDYQDNISTTPDDFEFGFYNTFDGADQANELDLITDPENFEVTDEIIVYVRVENENGCYKVVELALEAGIGPTTQSADYEICDDDGDGYGIFDLTQYDEELVVSDPSGLTYEYFMDNAGTQPIADPANFENTINPQIVYVKIYNPAAGDEGCISYEELTLFVKEFPEIQDDELIICDNLHDNSEFVDLTQNNTLVTGSIDVNYQYFPSLTDLQNGTDEITNPGNFEVTATTTEIYVNISAINSDCTDYAVYTITLNESPDAVDGSLENCSIDDISTFHLSDADELVIANPEDYEITYHTTYNNALNGTNDLPEEFENTTADQVIYARVEDSNGCYDISEITLSTVAVHEILPQVIAQCDDPYLISDGIGTFDLTEMDDDVEAALGGTGYTIEYYLSLASAQQGIGAIANPTEFENTSPTQTIYARAFGNDDGCAGTAEFEIEVGLVPEFTLDSEIAFCGSDTAKIYDFEGEFSSYTWYNSNGDVISNSGSVEFLEEGLHTLEVTSADTSCPARRDVEVIFDQGPTITEILVNGNTVTVNVAGSEGPFKFSYNNGLSWHDEYILENVPDGIHYMLVKSVNGCISSEKLFGVLGIPNVLTPNGDGYNDYFTVRALEMYPDAHIKIFDRYGKIFMDRKMSTDFLWDGTYQGRPIPSGDYWYIITVEDGKSVSGHISVRNR